MDGCSERVGWGEGFRAGSLLVCVCVSVIICDGLGHAVAAAGSMLRSTGQAGAEACYGIINFPLSCFGYFKTHRCTFVSSEISMSLCSLAVCPFLRH